MEEKDDLEEKVEEDGGGMEDYVDGFLVALCVEEKNAKEEEVVGGEDGFLVV